MCHSLWAFLSAFLGCCQILGAAKVGEVRDTLVILPQGGDVVGFNISQDPKRAILVEHPKAFRGVTSGYFVFEDQSEKWVLSHVGDIEHAHQLHLPTQNGEVVTGFCPSNAGERVAWALHVRLGNGRILVTDSATDRVLKAITKPALGWFATISTPAWSFDDQRLAYLYLDTPSIERENEPKASLLSLNLSPEGTEAQVMGPFLCGSAADEEIRWIAGDRLEFPMMKHSLVAGGSNDRFSVKADGQGLRREKDSGDAEVNYLTDGIHTLSHFVGKTVPGDHFLVTATLTDLKTGGSEDRRWTLVSKEGRTFISADGNYAAWIDYSRGLPGRWCVTDTRVDKTTELGVVSGSDNDSRVLWMHYPVQ